MYFTSRLPQARNQQTQLSPNLQAESTMLSSVTIFVHSECHFSILFVGFLLYPQLLLNNELVLCWCGLLLRGHGCKGKSIMSFSKICCGNTRYYLQTTYVDARYHRLMKWYICVSKGQRAIRHVSIHVVGCAPCPHPCLQTGVGAGRAPYFFPGYFKILTVHYLQMTNFFAPLPR